MREASNQERGLNTIAGRLEIGETVTVAELYRAKARHVRVADELAGIAATVAIGEPDETAAEIVRCCSWIGAALKVAADLQAGEEIDDTAHIRENLRRLLRELEAVERLSEE